MVTSTLFDLLSGFLGSVLSDVVAGLLLLALAGPVVRKLSRKKTRGQDHDEQPPEQRT
ncbi:hypothetical protein [Streptomyces anulatus]|uniref:hypothetical protein n=1 Tax=Streptomyces anulatus TaxID=1892 RepID=UPI002F912347|nr:hypothetical protein OG882_39130 [Streptomyces anulatus]